MFSTLRYALVLAAGTALGCGPTTSIDGTDGGTSTPTGAPSIDPSAATSSTSVATASSEPGLSESGPPDSSSAGSTSAGRGFLGPTDTEAGDIVACDSYLQDCPDGEKCNAYADDGGMTPNALGCFPVVPSPDQPGETCEVVGSSVSGIDTCDVGSMCWGLDNQANTGSCVALCEGSIDAPSCVEQGTTCSVANEAVLNLCLLSCDLESGDCPEGQICYSLGDVSVCAPDAGPTSGAPGASCENIESCDSGALCVTAAAHGPGCESSACCTEVCALSDPMCENPNQECQPWFEEGMEPPGYEDVGICVVPQ